jgi:hypothetical protein
VPRAEPFLYLIYDQKGQFEYRSERALLALEIWNDETKGKKTLNQRQVKKKKN